MRRHRFGAAAIGVAAALACVAALFGAAPAGATTPPPGLGTAGAFAVLGGTVVTNTGTTAISGDLGVSPGTAITGFPPGIVAPPGTIHNADAAAAQGQSDLLIAYNQAAGAPTTQTLTPPDLSGMTLGPGVYNFTSGALLNGVLTLSGNGVYIFQMASTLTTGPGSSVLLIGGAQPCGVFWQVGSSATLGTSTNFQGTVMALTSIAAHTGATVRGRLLARNGAVTLDTNVISAPAPGCVLAAATASASPVASPTVSAAAAASATPAPASGGGATGGPSVPSTGADVTAPLMLGILLLGAGALAVVCHRFRLRRPQTGGHTHDPIH